MREQKDILVYADWEGINGPMLMGTLVSTPAKGKEVFSFEYLKEWLKSGYTFMLDPELQLYPGQYFPRDEKPNFGVFLDSCPDRWGRALMDRREAAIARMENRAVKKLLESDYLLGVFDRHRMGGLRFKLNAEGNFLNDDSKMAAPPWTSIRELEDASKKFEEDNVDDKDYLKSINLLLAPGSSLGGARPKASVLDPNGHPWIAKFPSVNDDKNIGAWEMVVNKLAVNAGLTISQCEAKQFNSKYHTYLTKRFDRNDKGQRIHFASAMTLLGHNDGADHDIGVSYLDIVEFIVKNGSNVNADLEELWRRVVFYILVKNTDDHLRNHGFLLTPGGWRLSPAYDVNPVEYGTGLSLNISVNDNSLDLNLALSVASYFRLDEQKANSIIDQIKNSVSNWRSFANDIGISRQEQDRMKNAFVLNT